MSMPKIILVKKDIWLNWPNKEADPVGWQVEKPQADNGMIKAGDMLIFDHRPGYMTENPFVYSVQSDKTFADFMPEDIKNLLWDEAIQVEGKV